VTYKVRLPKAIRSAIGGCRLSRSALIRLLIRLHELESHAGNFTHNRAPENPDCFIFRTAVVDGAVWYSCRFLVNDRREAEVLAVESFSYSTRPTSEG